MSENRYAPPSLTMGHLGIKLRNLHNLYYHVGDKFSIPSVYYIFTLDFQTKDIYQIVKFTIQPNSMKENYLAH